MLYIHKFSELKRNTSIVRNDRSGIEYNQSGNFNIYLVEVFATY